MKTYFLLTLLTVLASFLLFSIHDVYAVAYDLKDQASCQSISGTWNNITSTCSTSNFYLNPGDSISVDNSVFSNISLTFTGTLDNNKGIINNSGNIILSNSAIFNNGGTVVNYCTAGCNAGTIQNEGTITNNKGGDITSNSTIDNLGSINNSGTITNNNGGTITNSAKFINNSGGFINNFGTIHNNELSAIINYDSGTITNYASIISDMGGTITNYGILKNTCNAIFISNGDLLGNSVNNTACTKTSKSSTVPEFPFTTLMLALSFLPLVVFYKLKK